MSESKNPAHGIAGADRSIVYHSTPDAFRVPIRYNPLSCIFFLLVHLCFVCIFPCAFFCESFSTRLPPSSSDSTCFSTIDKCHCRHKRDIKQCCAGQNKCITIVGAQRSYSMTLECEVFNLVVTRCGAVINSNLNSGMVACATRCNILWLAWNPVQSEAECLWLAKVLITYVPYMFKMHLTLGEWRCGDVMQHACQSEMYPHSSKRFHAALRNPNVHAPMSMHIKHFHIHFTLQHRTLTYSASEISLHPSTLLLCKIIYGVRHRRRSCRCRRQIKLCMYPGNVSSTCGGGSQWFRHAHARRTAGVYKLNGKHIEPDTLLRIVAVGMILLAATHI